MRRRKGKKKKSRREEKKESPHELGKEFSVFCRLLRELNAYSTHQWEKVKENRSEMELDDITWQLYEELAAQRHPIKQVELDTLISRQTERKLQIEQPIFLPPLQGNSDYLVLLYVNCFMDSFPPKSRLRIGMVKVCKDTESRQGIGFRFECGHSSKIHSYTHVQMIGHPFDNEKERDKDIEIADWIPHHYPAIILPSEDPVTLLLCLWISFYGAISKPFLSTLTLASKYRKPLEYLR